MSNPPKTVYVYADWAGLGTVPVYMGVLSVAMVRGKEVFSFAYNEDWLRRDAAHLLDPDLQLFSGPQYNSADRPNFGLFLDSSPDRWGRLLMKRREAITARLDGRKPSPLFESDFLLGVYDQNRMGSLRFKTETEGELLAAEKRLATPPWTSLRELEWTSLALEADEEADSEQTLTWLNLLLAPGSSLGGARPKANIVGPDGSLWIAKFPSGRDDHNVGAWEMVAFRLAVACGLKVSEAQAKKFSGRHHTFLNRRFDRDSTGRRIHFASAMTLLGYNDGADFHEGVSYLELAEFIQRQGSDVAADLKELWKRIVLNICIRNTDDHLRNHGFLLTPGGWTLSPVYDVNPAPTGTGLTLNITEDDNSLNLDLALSVAPQFRLKAAEAKAALNEMINVVQNWRKVAKDVGLPVTELSDMEEAFAAVE